MKEKKLSNLVLNKKVISKLNKSFITGGKGYEDNNITTPTAPTKCTECNPDTVPTMKCI